MLKSKPITEFKSSLKPIREAIVMKPVFIWRNFQKIATFQK
jgi:hypothetical protein